MQRVASWSCSPGAGPAGLQHVGSPQGEPQRHRCASVIADVHDSCAELPEARASAPTVTVTLTRMPRQRALSSHGSQRAELSRPSPRMVKGAAWWCSSSQTVHTRHGAGGDRDDNSTASRVRSAISLLATSSSSSSSIGWSSASSNSSSASAAMSSGRRSISGVSISSPRPWSHGAALASGTGRLCESNACDSN